MALIIGSKNISKAYGARPLFQEISIGISDADRIGMIGPNGSGKSTLLKILAGIESPDSGEVSISRNARVCYMSQEDVFPKDRTVREVLLQTLENHHLEDYEKTVEVEIMLDKVGFQNPDQLVGELSGGWRKRLAIACKLMEKPDLLLMDEPTNHLDLEGILWLEKILKSARFAYLVISHDRYFLESVSERVIELNKRYPEGHFSAQGSYSDFLVAREEFFQNQLSRQESLENKVRREVDWLRRGPKARTTKANARIQDAQQMIENLDELKYRNAQTRAVKIDFTSSERQAKKVLLCEGLQKSLGGRKLFTDLDIVLSPGTKLGLLGLNGSGKTTLLKIMTGEMLPDAGRIERAEHLRAVLFDQNREQLNPDWTLKRALAPEGDQVIYRGEAMHIVTWARKFLFTAEQLETPVKELSGGERARILIARLMQQPADLLILDEPTNDLDIPTLEVLEESLLDFPGALVLVTHDRYMLDRISTQLLALDGEGGAVYFADYSQWEKAQSISKQKPAAEKIKTTEKHADDSPPKIKKLSYKEKQELQGMEANIMAAEEQVGLCQAHLNDDKVIADPVKLQTACAQLQKAQQQVDYLYERWAELTALAKN